MTHVLLSDELTNSQLLGTDRWGEVWGHAVERSCSCGEVIRGASLDTLNLRDEHRWHVNAATHRAPFETVALLSVGVS